MSSLPTPRRIAVLVSGSGTNLQALLDAIATDDDFAAEVVVVGSDVAEAGGLDRARTAGIESFAEPLADHPDRATWEAALRADLEAHDIEVVVLAGFMRILSAAFLDGWPGRVINTHPSLLPAFRGANAVGEALEHGVKVTGSTVHLVDEEVDHGPNVAQQAVAIEDGDTEDTLHARIKAVEHELLPACVKLLSQGRLVVDGRHVRVMEAVK